MAFNITSTYTGDAANEFVSKALFGGKTLAGKHINVIPNIKKKRALKLLDEGNIIQAAGCGWDPSGTITLTERILEPVDLKVNVEVCVNDLKDSWEAEKLTAGASNNDIPFDQYIRDRYIAKTAEGVDYLIWQGKESGSTGIYLTYPFLTEADGFVTKMLADGTVVDVTGTTLSASNILTEVGKVYDALPLQLVDKSDLVIFISFAAARFYKRAMATASGNPNFNLSEDQPLDYLGITLVPVQLPTNTMVMTHKGNMFFGTDLLSDTTSVETIDFKIVGRDMVGFKMMFSADVQYAYGSEVVLYN